MHYWSLGSYVSLPLVIKTTHLKAQEFNFFSLFVKSPKVISVVAFHRSSTKVPQARNIMPDFSGVPH